MEHMSHGVAFVKPQFFLQRSCMNFAGQAFSSLLSVLDFFSESRKDVHCSNDEIPLETNMAPKNGPL